MKLKQLVQNLDTCQVLNPDPELELNGICLDSRLVRKGDLFAALPGTKSDGTQFARQALERGAVAVLTERELPMASLPQVIVPQARAALCRAARIFHGQPDLGLRIGGVTGTNGKSTTAYLVRHLLQSSRMPCGLLGTIEYDLGGEAPLLTAPMTTPEAPDLFAYLRSMADNGCRAAVMEVSSHSLCQHRVDGIDFSVAVFTNLTQDHLDYHRTMQEYRDAKAILFQNLSPKATAVLNFDDPVGKHYAKLTKAEVLGFSVQNERQADLRAKILKMDIHGTRFRITSPWGSREVYWRLVGAHNVENGLAALGAGLALGAGEFQTFNFDQALVALESFRGVPGRLQSVEFPNLPFRVLVDYAHTEDALHSVLTALRELKPSRIIAVFGCGGDRDKTKRPRMGKAVEDLADLGIVTSDNPRTEDPRAIIAQIWEGIERKEKFIVEADRSAAIDLAIREARPGDVVLIAGKGHEDYQIVGTQKRHFDDRQEASAALAKRFGK